MALRWSGTPATCCSPAARRGRRLAWHRPAPRSGAKARWRHHADDGRDANRLLQPGEIALCVVRMLKESTIVTTDGTRIATRIDTICLHGGTADADLGAKRIREALRSEGIGTARFDGGA
ncbi:LamB/YcsF family protein [Leisingera sp. ANG-M1]|uniref:LamB/YcsF family protein n=1 Tax=Leisingera sp. ANG-M1 TaxID=1577895 RepID=UPI0009E37ED2|nr:LamB/YcsF family protein [Leisingera sp. ANG-M1]